MNLRLIFFSFFNIYKILLITFHVFLIFNFYFAAFAFRLRGGASNWGRVEVRHKGVWGQVCREHFTDNEAKVACRSAGYKNGVHYGMVKEGHIIYWLKDLKCNGNETRLDKCKIDRWGSPVSLATCTPTYVLCYNEGK